MHTTWPINNLSSLFLLASAERMGVFLFVMGFLFLLIVFLAKQITHDSPSSTDLADQKVLAQAAAVAAALHRHTAPSGESR